MHNDTKKINVHVYSSLMGVFIPLHHIPTPCNKNRFVLSFFWAYTRNENHQNVSSFRKFSFFVLGTPLIYYQPSSSCNNTIILIHVLYHICHLWEKVIGGVPWDLDMEMVAFTEFLFFLFNSPPLFLLTQVLFSPTDTVLMLVTYHRNFCSHHGHHLCRGKIGDMMAFPLSQLRAQSSPTSPISMHSCQGVRLRWKCLTRGMR